jgi:hypothetical protein
LGDRLGGHERRWRGERGLLQLAEVAIEGVGCFALALGQANPDWAGIGRIALGTFATAGLMAAVKYLKAQRDMPLAEPIAAVLTGAAQQVAARTGLHDAKTGVVWPNLNVTPLSDATVTTNSAPTVGS